MTRKRIIRDEEHFNQIKRYAKKHSRAEVQNKFKIGVATVGRIKRAKNYDEYYGESQDPVTPEINKIVQDMNESISNIEVIVNRMIERIEKLEQKTKKKSFWRK